MGDVYQPDPDRILINTTTGVAQAWGGEGDHDIVVSVSFDCLPRNGGDGHSMYSHFMTVADARSLAEALLKCADHAEALVPKEEAA